jgi:hypothetical protein
MAAAGNDSERGRNERVLALRNHGSLITP